MPVEKIGSSLDQLIALDAELEWLVPTGLGFVDDDGYRTGAAEGPVWWDELDSLVLTSMGRSLRYRWNDSDGLTVDREGTNGANGLTRDHLGRLISCEEHRRRVTRTEPDGSITVVADSYHGWRLNRPNDVVVRSDGTIYFTDPITLGVDSDLDFAGVYTVAPDLGRIHCVVRDFVFPNGLCFSPNEKLLYINDSARRHIRVFDVGVYGNDALLDLSTDRVFCDMSSSELLGVPDGMKVDSAANVYCTGPGGVWIVAPSGEQVGIIRLPDGEFATNLCFGGPDRDMLYITTLDGLARIPVRTPGIKASSPA
ncbi:MAG TPA: SMP-30/gluconolactonase/LRE family protein [Solirubrobacteraceae bacterium]|nr:SMP-30/gluconolactonase/LRE family protein [Solirubrobacteraceae bacterium]